MFEQFKLVFTDEYKRQISHYEDLKNEMNELEMKIKDKSSEEEYNKSLKKLNNSFSIFKRKSKEYLEQLNEIKTTYMEKLKEFENNYNRYLEIRSEASKIDVYGIQKKLEQLNNANSLEELKIKEEDAVKMLEEVVKG